MENEKQNDFNETIENTELDNTVEKSERLSQPNTIETDTDFSEGTVNAENTTTSSEQQPLDNTSVIDEWQQINSSSVDKESSQVAVQQPIAPKTEPNFTMNGEAFKDSSAEPEKVVADVPPKSDPIKKVVMPNNRKNSKRTSPVLLIMLTLLIGIGSGFGGSLLYNTFFHKSSVIYRSVSGSNSNSSANADSLSVKDIADKTMDSVVEIKTESVTMNDFFQQAVQGGAGSGVIMSEDGYIVTNFHVIEGANKVTVRTRDGKSYEAKFIGSDASSDLAVIKIEESGLTCAVQGNSDSLNVGDGAIAIGNPLGELGGTVTTGIISALDREIQISGETMHLLQTNAAINPGNSGGGLFNTAGELIGIVNAKSSGSGVEGLGFAIPMNLAKEVIDSLISDGYVKGRPAIGISIQEVSNQNPFSDDKNVELYIAQLTKGGAAESAGLEVGDQIVKIDDEAMNSAADIKELVNSHKAGDTVVISIMRNKESKKVKVKLQEQTQEKEEATPQSANDSFHN